jgi:hypothetical protein
LRSARYRPQAHHERARTWFRSHRAFPANDFWYFHTHQGIDVGPFGSEFEAQVESNIPKHMLNETPDVNAAVSMIRESVLDMRNVASDLKGLTNYVEQEGHF